MWRWWCAVFFILHQASGEYNCHMRGTNIICTALREGNLQENMTVSLGKESSNTIKELKIADSSLFIIKREMFVNFVNLQNVYLQNTRMNYIDEDAFTELLSLRKLYLTDNYLGKISSRIFSVNNTLDTLDLSQNILNDLSDFDISMFPSLTLLNISHNKLEFLPEGILNKLKEEPNFYVIVDNNPWNCDHLDWNMHLTTELIDAFCTNNIYDSSAVDEKLKMLSSGYAVLESTNQDSVICSAKCALPQCLLWMFGAIWIGIILGNVCKIKRLLFTTPTKYEDKTTQCDKLDLMSKV